MPGILPCFPGVHLPCVLLLPISPSPASLNDLALTTEQRHSVQLTAASRIVCHVCLWLCPLASSPVKGSRVYCELLSLSDPGRLSVLPEQTSRLSAPTGRVPNVTTLTTASPRSAATKTAVGARPRRGDITIPSSSSQAPNTARGRQMRLSTISTRALVRQSMHAVSGPAADKPAPLPGAPRPLISGYKLLAETP